LLISLKNKLNSLVEKTKSYTTYFNTREMRRTIACCKKGNEGAWYKAIICALPKIGLKAIGLIWMKLNC
jgi:hypothetical protein